MTWLKCAIAAAVLAVSGQALAGEPFTLQSSSFADGAVLAPVHSGVIPNRPACAKGAQNVSPQISWRDAPAGAKSIAIFMVDPAGRNGLGITHWVAYGISPELGGLNVGEGSKSPTRFIGGKNSLGMDHYLGPCPMGPTPYRHYTLVAVATDLTTDTLPAGLTLPELLQKLDGHALASAGLVARFRAE